MVRAPCCEKMGLKKGPWTSEEDQLLTNYIQLHGHGNWRALPKLAGLLRCGKSCRLRWTNYLRPDIKRGNFSREEEDTIIQLHDLLGNKWSAIAAKLPGRTDNEIKNVWHTHLKKKLPPKENSATGSSLEEQSSMIFSDSQADRSDSEKELDSQLQFPLDSFHASNAFSGSSDVHESDEMEFWNELYAKTGDLFEISDF